MAHISKYAQAWEILKEYKTLTLTLDNPRVERTVREGVIKYKKLDKTKNPLERIKVKKTLADGKLQLHFTLVPTTRWRLEYFDLDTPSDSSDEFI